MLWVALISICLVFLVLVLLVWVMKLFGYVFTLSLIHISEPTRPY